jgi:hypothetical protein
MVAINSLILVLMGCTPVGSSPTTAPAVSSSASSYRTEVLKATECELICEKLAQFDCDDAFDTMCRQIDSHPEECKSRMNVQCALYADSREEIKKCGARCNEPY